MISSLANLAYELPYKLPNYLRHIILGNKKILAKSRIWVKTKLSAQSPFQKLNFGNSSQKTRKKIYQTFLFQSSFTGFLYFLPNILPRCFLIKLLVCFILFVLLFLVTPSLIVAVQPCMEWITIKKNKTRKVSSMRKKSSPKIKLV